MTYTIAALGPVKTGVGQYNNTVYTLKLKEEADWVEILQKPEKPAPQVGETVEGEIETTQFGKRLKRMYAQGGGGYRNDPETRKEIIRQNALTNAVNYCTKKAELLAQMGIIKTQADVDKQLSGKNVVQVATHFAKYSLGEINVVTQNTETDQAVKQTSPDAEETPTAEDDVTNLDF